MERGEGMGEFSETLDLTPTPRGRLFFASGTTGTRGLSVSAIFVAEPLRMKLTSALANSL
jgi:hypothetical protein